MKDTALVPASIRRSTTPRAVSHLAAAVAAFEAAPSWAGGSSCAAVTGAIF